MPVLTRVLLKFLKDFVYLLLQLGVLDRLGLELLKQRLIATTQSDYLLLDVAADPKNFINFVTNLFDFARLGPKSLHCSLIKGRSHILLILRQLCFQLIIVFYRSCNLLVNLRKLGRDNILVDRGLSPGH